MLTIHSVPMEVEVAERGGERVGDAPGLAFGALASFDGGPELVEERRGVGGDQRTMQTVAGPPPTALMSRSRPGATTVTIGP